MDKAKRKNLILLAIILLFGAFLRIYLIGEESFWMDEGASALTIKLYNGVEILKNVYLYGQTLPGFLPGISDLPFYHPTLYYWSRLFSISETSLRMYSALFGILSMIPVYFIARELFGNKNALLSTFLFSFSLSAINYAQEARPYSAYLFFGLCSIYYFIMSLKSNRNYHWGLYILFSLLGLYTHFLFEILLVFQALYLAFWLFAIKGLSLKEAFMQLRKWKKGHVQKIFISLFIIMLLSMPLILRTFRTGNAEDWREKPTLGLTLRFFVKYATWIYPDEELKNKVASNDLASLKASDYLLLASVAMVVLISYLAFLNFLISKIIKKWNFRQKFSEFAEENQNALFAFGWWAVPVIFSCVVSFLTPIPIFGPFNYMLYTLPAFNMMMAEGLLLFRKKYFKIIIVFFLLLNVMPVYSYYANIKWQQWREMSEYMKNVAGNDELIIISRYSGEVTFRYYYGDSDKIKGVKNVEEVSKLVKDQDSLWLILSFWKYGDPKGLIQDYINQHYYVVESKKFFDIDVYHYRKK